MRINLLGNKIPSIKRILPKIDLNSSMKKSDIFIECTPDMFESTTLRPDFGKINTPIADEKEYKTLLAKLKHTITHNGNYAYFTENDMEKYGKVDLFEHGLIPYCGQDDCHSLINAYLGSRLTKLEQEVWKLQMPYDLDTIPDVIRLLEYSLNRLDNKYGKYKGIVYRNGYFNPLTDKQFYSTSTESINAVRHGNNYLPAEDNQYSIILLKNGHNINEFQKSADSFIARKYAETENEILIDRHSVFRLLPEYKYSEEIKRLQAVLLAQALKKDDDINENDIRKALKNHSDLLKYISVREEI